MAIEHLMVLLFIEQDPVQTTCCMTIEPLSESLSIEQSTFTVYLQSTGCVVVEPILFVHTYMQMHCLYLIINTTVTQSDALELPTLFK